MNLLAYLLLAGAPAPPATDQFEFDIQCMVAAQLATEQLKGELALATQMAAMYYFGRVDSALSEAAIEERMAAAGRALEGRPIGPLLEQCGTYMQERGKVMEKIGGRLEAREKAGQLH